MDNFPFFLFISPERNCSSFYAMHSLVFVMRRQVRGYLPPLVFFQVCARPAFLPKLRPCAGVGGSSAGLAIPSFEGMQAKGHNFLTSVNFSHGSSSEVKPPLAVAKLRPSLLAQTPRGALVKHRLTPTKPQFGGFGLTANGGLYPQKTGKRAKPCFPQS
jgi:hypothetical protein